LAKKKRNIRDEIDIVFEFRVDRHERERLVILAISNAVQSRADWQEREGGVILKISTMWTGRKEMQGTWLKNRMK